MVKRLRCLGELDPARGAEVPKTRPCIVSRTEANDVSSTVTIVPLSSVRGRAADRMAQPLISTRDTLLPKDSRVLCDQVRTITNDVFEERWECYILNSWQGSIVG